MHHLKLLCVVATVAWFAVLGYAQPTKKAAVLISAENAHKVRLVKEVDKPVSQMMRGPKAGELVIQSATYGPKNARSAVAEIVDDTEFRQIRLLAKDRNPWSVAVSPDGKFVAYTDWEGERYTVQEIESGKSFDIETGRVLCDAAFSPDSKLLALGYLYSKPRTEGQGYSEIRLFDVTGKHLRTLGKNGYGPNRAVFSPDGKTLAAANRNLETQLFDVESGKLLHTLGKKMTMEVAFSPDGKTLAEAYVDGTVGLWDVATGKLLRSAESVYAMAYSVDWSPKGDVLVSSGWRGKIVLWEPGTLKKLKELDAPEWVNRARFTADGTRLLTSSGSETTATKDRKITVWAVADGPDR